MFRHHVLATAIVVSLAPLAWITRSLADDSGIGRIGVLGDSYSDEYQFYPPDRSLARNWVEILAATRGLDFGEFSDLDRGTPRHQGFAFNWARSDATTEDMIAEGQHLGLAEQVARGEVELAILFIGGNDLIHALHSDDPEGALDGLVDRMAANLQVALDAILEAHPEARAVVATVPDIRHLPEFRRPLNAGTLPGRLLDAYSVALQRYNNQIKLLAFHPGRLARVAVVDLHLATRLADAISTDHVVVGGRKIDRNTPANDLDHFFLADGRHSGTIGQALLAKLILEAMNAKFNAGVASLEETEVLGFAASLLAPRDDLAAKSTPVVGLDESTVGRGR